ncbi:Terminal quinol oxidase, subunit, putative (doxD-like) [Labilithrix luteola]|uniref:Terminal quinol oxidase, subunit, putative (DoxD-like) n=1 Tax=Labilithrix luteola TaxID=1391654 RepID=A0A0K1Q3B2_9BACT|nr:TQO small subunit DoxD [Labilithrix luteola]AKV00254.1 Terminal quinol oxidase, subunit, putative (doxD-like) [Labilithrix luteola]
MASRTSDSKSIHPSLALLPIRLVTGWMFFSAFHRRVVLDAAKLVPGAPGYVGEKFNQFMPGSIFGVGDLIATLLDRPAALHAFLWTFTIIEALVGLALIVGLGTRLAAFGTLMLSVGILFGSGWLGPTCLDEWQIGALGIAGGATVMLGGAGPFSLDAWLARVRPSLFGRRWMRLFADASPKLSLVAASVLTVFSVVVTLVTNQVFYGGIWGTLHNDSVRPRVDVLDARTSAGGELAITLERPAGPETYGAFVVDLRVFDERGELVRHYDAAALSALGTTRIDNRWLLQVRSGPHGLVVPLGARATVTLPTGEGTPALPPGEYRIELEDVSGIRWAHVVDLHRLES